MKRILFIVMALPLFALAQEKNVISVSRIFPKAGKMVQLEKALANHAKMYHKGDTKWRVYSIETGPDAGGYHIVEGPVTWESLDKRGDLGMAHTADYDLNVNNISTEKYMSGYNVYRADLSTSQLLSFSDKIAINHVFAKPGYSEELEAMVNNLKKVWTASDQSIAVYEASSSGAPQLTIVTRYKDGLKEREANFRKPMKERFVSANGEGSWATYQQGLKNAVDHSWSEILFYRADLSSK